jgi:hypothetical protein
MQDSIFAAISRKINRELKRLNLDPDLSPKGDG